MLILSVDGPIEPIDALLRRQRVFLTFSPSIELCSVLSSGTTGGKSLALNAEGLKYATSCQLAALTTKTTT